MDEACRPLLGLHDFAAFCKRREGATTVRTLLDLDWSRDDDGLAVATVRADAFCHHMVRSLVGCLLAVGEGRRPVGWAGARCWPPAVRDPAVTVVPAHGLTLEEVGYPDPTRARRAGRPGPREDGDLTRRDRRRSTTSPPTRRCRSRASRSAARCGASGWS